MEEENIITEVEVEESCFQKVSIIELIVRFKTAKKNRNKTCFLNKLIFELDEGENYTFNRLLSNAEVITSSGLEKRVDIKLIFVNCIFKSKLYFYNLTFNDYSSLSFTECKLEGELQIEKCFLDKLEISAFNKQNLENNNSQKGSLYIKKCNIQNRLSISSTNIDSLYLETNELNDLFIDECKNTNILHVYENIIKNKFAISNCTINYFEYIMSSEQSCKVNIQDSTFNERIGISEGIIDTNFIFRNCNLKSFTFKDAILDKARIISCKFEDYILYDEQQLFEKEKIKGEVKAGISEEIKEGISEEIKEGINEEIKKEIKEEIYSLVLYQYKALESNFDYYKNYEEAGKFHKRQFEVQRQYATWRELKKYILWFYNVFSGYGESYVRSIASFFSILIIFALIYLGTGLDYVNNVNNINDTSKTVSTIYYGDSKNMYNPVNDIGVSILYSISNTLPIRKDIDSIKPANEWTRFFSYIEVTFQSVILTLFVIALRRKFKR